MRTGSLNNPSALTLPAARPGRGGCARCTRGRPPPFFERRPLSASAIRQAYQSSEVQQRHTEKGRAGHARASCCDGEKESGRLARSRGLGEMGQSRATGFTGCTHDEICT